MPRDRDGSFEPKVAEKRRRRLTGVDEMVLSLSAKGLTTGEVHAHLAEVQGAEVSRRNYESWNLAGSGIDPVLVGPGGGTDWRH
ncbi:hypothetical protein GCM10010345_84630 [Streptomyces canarius]|uniref:Mutator family transposase n=1 Tax=Streptomyces canarius TaxID=285453 RepID=A0ABQ3D973_9ACTN|nr:hypothetical protein GCM10010345_84630 [Streptomyces canarius]